MCHRRLPMTDFQWCREGRGRGGRKVLSKPLADSFDVSRSQKEMYSFLHSLTICNKVASGNNIWCSPSGWYITKLNHRGENVVWGFHSFPREMQQNNRLELVGATCLVRTKRVYCNPCSVWCDPGYGFHLYFSAPCQWTVQGVCNDTPWIVFPHHTCLGLLKWGAKRPIWFLDKSELAAWLSS
jgi:hypothetical protein